MNKISSRSVLCMSIAFLLLTATATKANQQFMIENGFGNEKMILLGSALKKFLTFRVVTVNLYISKDYNSEDVLSDTPKLLEVNYHVNIPKQELDRATIKGIKQNFSQKELNELMPQIEQINSYYPDIKSGDQIIVSYVPGVGSQIKLNGQVKGVVPSAKFAEAFFAIWVGENPVDKLAKLKLLGKKNSVKILGENID